MNSVITGDEKDIVKDFMEDCRLRNMTGKSIQSYLSCLRIYFGFLEQTGIGLKTVDRQVLKLFLNYLRFERKVKQKTVKEYFSALSSFWDYMVEEGAAASNIVLPFRRRYLRQYKDEYEAETRKLLTVEEMSLLINSMLDPRDKAMATLFAKTGVRRNELQNMDVGDVDWAGYSITLKPARKRSNRVVFFDEEAAYMLRRWLGLREEIVSKSCAMFISYQTLGRLDRNGIYSSVTKYAQKLGFHNPDSPRLQDHFGPHCFRHFFTTMLLRNGMQREYVKELRGDSRREAIDIYHHIDREDLRRSYLACIPKLGV